MDIRSTPLPPMTLTPDIIDALRAPFPWDVIEVRPGSVRKDGTGALALAYADPRVYMARLDAVVGPEHWSVEFAPWGEHRLICRLTMFGVVKCSTGEADSKDKNAGTVAEAQAFKRACVAFGLGRYLYDLAQVWARGSGDSKSFKFENPARIVEELRRKYELAHAKPPPVPARSPALPSPAVPEHTDTAPAPTRQPRPTPVRPPQPVPADKQASARAALNDAERRTGVPPQRTTR